MPNNLSQDTRTPGPEKRRSDKGRSYKVGVVPPELQCRGEETASPFPIPLISSPLRSLRSLRGSFPPIPCTLRTRTTLLHHDHFHSCSPDHGNAGSLSPGALRLRGDDHEHTAAGPSRCRERVPASRHDRRLGQRAGEYPCRYDAGGGGGPCVRRSRERCSSRQRPSVRVLHLPGKRRCRAPCLSLRSDLPSRGRQRLADPAIRFA